MPFASLFIELEEEKALEKALKPRGDVWFKWVLAVVGRSKAAFVKENNQLMTEPVIYVAPYRGRFIINAGLPLTGIINFSAISAVGISLINNWKSIVAFDRFSGELREAPKDALSITREPWTDPRFAKDLAAQLDIQFFFLANHSKRAASHSLTIAASGNGIQGAAGEITFWYLFEFHRRQQKEQQSLFGLGAKWGANHAILRSALHNWVKVVMLIDGEREAVSLAGHRR